MQALDGPTLKLLPSVRAMRESGSSIASGHAIGASAAAGGQDLAEQRASMEERHAWQEKQRWGCPLNTGRWDVLHNDDVCPDALSIISNASRHPWSAKALCSIT